MINIKFVKLNFNVTSKKVFFLLHYLCYCLCLNVYYILCRIWVLKILFRYENLSEKCQWLIVRVLYVNTYTNIQICIFFFFFSYFANAHNSLILPYLWSQNSSLAAGHTQSTGNRPYFPLYIHHLSLLIFDIKFYPIIIHTCTH